MTTFRVLFCGDREWTDKELIHNVLVSFLRLPEVLIEGECRGADVLSREVAEAEGIPVLPFPAEWSRYDRAAGPIRNQKMLDEGKPSLVVAFHDDLGRSKGTKRMISQALKAGIKVLHVSHSGVEQLDPADLPENRQPYLW